MARFIRKYDKDVDGKMTFKEFISVFSPLTQYSVKAKDISRVLFTNNT